MPISRRVPGSGTRPWSCSRGGVGRVGLRAAAARAGVSHALVLHHFGSKEGLRKECDMPVRTSPEN
ncbi:TetR family transcriptional regulator [Nonomuraea rubra]|uniref:TetR family transcriptional regulator n=1 Tax=Nonomuraea rubra TaxID=46180 RepID=UPI00340D0F47